MACASEHSVMDDVVMGAGRESWMVLSKAAAAVFDCIARTPTTATVALVVATTITQKFWLTFGLEVMRKFLELIVSTPESGEALHGSTLLQEVLTPVKLPRWPVKKGLGSEQQSKELRQVIEQEFITPLTVLLCEDAGLFPEAAEKLGERLAKLSDKVRTWGRLHCLVDQPRTGDLDLMGSVLNQAIDVVNAWLRQNNINLGEVYPDF